ncbi:hypothetical protein [Pontibacter cellulosilyticus]|uniref:Uncharacterized protein n=1 Tax=Pontibacter cellulosilyticus TaxID=1720253 RepID=A0A923SJM9_9BACT|nr:hypothetical protein [Pontibacter cellulosilyticus]MBC5994059.1 hypothetical protein [Pontibacter cellulosilyticus]
MRKLWQPVREFLPIAAILLLCLIVVPVAQANGNGNGNGSNGATTATVQQNTTPATTTTAASAETAKVAKAKPKAPATKPQNKSVLDTEVLDSPIGYFKKAFTSEEDEADATANNGAVMITVKALIATLLSTIM